MPEMKPPRSPWLPHALNAASTTLAVAACAVFATGLPAHSQTAEAWPSKPIRMVVGYPAGSSPDMQARLLAEPLGKALGQPVVVENRPGASGNIGAETIAKATDGHTIGVVGNGPLTSSQYLYSKLPYDANTDFAPLALIGAAPLVWVTAKSTPERTVVSYLQQLRTEGDKHNYGSIGPGSGGHLGMELLKQALGIAPLHVPYNGGPAIINAILGGHVGMSLLPASTVSPLVQSGKLEAIAVTSAQRSPLAPTLPGLEDIGVKGVNIEVWNAVMAPAKMPAVAQNRLATELANILTSRDIRQKLLVQGWRVDDPSAKALRERIRKDAASYKDIIAKNHIRID